MTLTLEIGKQNLVLQNAKEKGASLLMKAKRKRLGLKKAQLTILKVIVVTIMMVAIEMVEVMLNILC